jgi:hypothetical protein
MMAIKPWGGKHANLLHSLRSQGTNQLTRRDHPGLCETVLPMLGRAVRTHVGVRTDVQTFLAATDTTPGNAPVRTHQELASGTAAGAIPSSWCLATRLTAPGSPAPRFTQSPSMQCHKGALLSTVLGSDSRMPAAQAYKPPAHSRLTPTIVVRRYPRSGRLPVKTIPKNISCNAQPGPRSLPVKFAVHLGAPNYRVVVVGSPAQRAGYPAWVQGTALPLGGRAARAPDKKLSVAN